MSKDEVIEKMARAIKETIATADAYESAITSGRAGTICILPVGIRRELGSALDSLRELGSPLESEILEVIL